MSHLQQPQAGLDWHLVQQSVVVRLRTIAPMLLSPPMMMFSRKADALQHVLVLVGAAARATENESGWGYGCTKASSAASSALCFMLHCPPPSDILISRYLNVERSLGTTRQLPTPAHCTEDPKFRTAPRVRTRAAVNARLSTDNLARARAI